MLASSHSVKCGQRRPLGLTEHRYERDAEKDVFGRKRHILPATVADLQKQMLNCWHCIPPLRSAKPALRPTGKAAPASRGAASAMGPFYCKVIFALVLVEPPGVTLLFDAVSIAPPDTVMNSVASL